MSTRQGDRVKPDKSHSHDLRVPDARQTDAQKRVSVSKVVFYGPPTAPPIMRASFDLFALISLDNLPINCMCRQNKR